MRRSYRNTVRRPRMPYRFWHAVFFRRPASGGFDLLGARDQAYLRADEKFKLIANLHVCNTQNNAKNAILKKYRKRILEIKNLMIP